MVRATLWFWRRITVRLCTRVTIWTRWIGCPRVTVTCRVTCRWYLVRFTSLKRVTFWTRLTVRYLVTVLLLVTGARAQSTHWPWAWAGACIVNDAAAASTAAPHSPFRYVLIFRFSKL